MTQEERQKAFDAALVLDVLGDVFMELDARYVSAWRAATDPQAREDSWQRQRALLDVKLCLFSRIENAALKAGGKDKSLNAARNKARSAAKMGV